LHFLQLGDLIGEVADVRVVVPLIAFLVILKEFEVAAKDV